jgi:hypothetical protein
MHALHEMHKVDTDCQIRSTNLFIHSHVLSPKPLYEFQLNFYGMSALKFVEP